MIKKSQEYFIQKARKVHNNKYDYSKVNYINTRTKVTIICPYHGEFQQLPSGHLRGQRCGYCYSKTLLSNDEFIKRALIQHNNKYDYSKVVYSGSNTKVTIICSIHGEFEQTPSSHLGGFGCSKCRYDKIKSLLSGNLTNFIEKSKAIHGDKYDYCKVNYINSYTKVTIICNKHGEFEQTPSGHLSGNGCQRCRNELISNKFTSNEKQFIEKAKVIHGDRYDYSKVIYKYHRQKIIIICSKHGEFQQTPEAHLSGNGCQRCGQDVRRLSKEQFIFKANQIHNNIYDYSEVVYINNITKVTIICPYHGEFQQPPNGHLRGNGCQKCKSSIGELTIKAILDKHNIPYIQEYRIPNQIYRFRYDFYLTEYKLLIEFHGKQHYECIPYFHTDEDGFLLQKKRDVFKKWLAKELKIVLLEFNYKQLKNLSKSQFETLVMNSIEKFK